MQDTEHPFNKIPTQQRSEKAIENIFEAARALVAKNEPSQLSARNLAERSGYSVGSIYRYFEKIDDVFTHIFISRRKRVCMQLVEKIELFPNTGSASLMLEMIVDHSMSSWGSHNYSVIKLLSRHFFKRAKEPEQFSKVIDVLIPSLIALERRNVTNTIRKLSEFEVQLFLRAIQAAVRSPFLEGDPKAGSPEHRAIVFAIGAALFILPQAKS